jgi:hypothetical protein
MLAANQALRGYCLCLTVLSDTIVPAYDQCSLVPRSDGRLASKCLQAVEVWRAVEAPNSVGLALPIYLKQGSLFNSLIKNWAALLESRGPLAGCKATRTNWWKPPPLLYIND